MPRYYRKIIRITGDDSPNVRLAKEQIANGMEPTGEVVVHGVLPWADYLKRRTTWSPEKQCVGLDANFWQGTETLLYPPQWLNWSERLADLLRGLTRRALGIGIDPAEGGDKTAMAAVDQFGLIEIVSQQTPNTAVITSEAIAFMERHGVPPERVVFDTGGGGKQHADRLRMQGYKVRAVAFGQSPTVGHSKQRGRYIKKDSSAVEQRATYKNLRAEMYGTLRELMDPRGMEQDDAVPDPDKVLQAGGWVGFAIPSYCANLLSELAPIPLIRDGEGVLELPPKYRKGKTSEGSVPGGKTLVELIGHSPDEADALVLAVHAMRNNTYRPKIRSMVR